MIDNAKVYFQVANLYKLINQNLKNEELENKKFILYYDGSSKVDFEQSGKARFENGRKLHC